MATPSDLIDQRISTGRVIVIVIPSFLTLLVLILLVYLTSIVSAFNHSQTLSACRGRVSQEIQETFRKDVSKLIALAGEAADGPKQRAEQKDLLDQMADRPSYVDQVRSQCHQDISRTKSLVKKSTPDN